MTSTFRGQSSDYYEIWQADAKWDADDYTQVKIETGSRIKIWLSSFLWNRMLFSLSRALAYIIEIW